MIHRINVFLLSIILVLSQVLIINSANASTVGGWSMGNPVAQGASAVYTGTKNVIINGADYIKKGTAKITPTASQVAKVLRGGAAGYALSIAVEQLLGSVDWVLDPANNSIRYYENDPTVPPNTCATHKLINIDGKNRTLSEISQYLRSTTEQRNPSNYAQDYVGITSVSCSNNSVTINWEKKWCTSSCSPGVVYPYERHPIHSVSYGTIVGEAPTEEEKRISLETVAQQVISNAAGGDTNAQAATMAAAADIVDEASKDETKARPIAQQLESTAKTTPADEAAADSAGTATGESTANPETGATDLKLEFPIFCNWAPSVCEAAQVVISFPQTLTQWWETSTTAISDAWTSVKEWVKPQEVPETDTKVEIEAPVEPPVKNDYLQWSAYCPFTADSSEISLNGESSSIDSDLTSWCTMASELRPFVILAGAIASLMIVSGVGLGRGDD